MRDPGNEVGSHRQPMLAILTKQLRIRVLCGVLPGIPRLPAMHICKKTDKRKVKFPKELRCCIHSDAQCENDWWQRSLYGCNYHCEKITNLTFGASNPKPLLKPNSNRPTLNCLSDIFTSLNRDS